MKFVIKLVYYHPAEQQVVIAKHLPLPIVWVLLKSMGTWNPERGFQTFKAALPLAAHTSPRNTAMPWLTLLTTPSCNSFNTHISTPYTSNFTLDTVVCPKFTLKTALPFDDHHQNLIHPYQARPLSPSATAYGSTQPFCHNTDRQTDRQTDRPIDGIEQMFDHISHLRSLYFIDSAVANNNDNKTEVCYWELVSK